ncbi:thermosome subunit gamma [Rhynchospora pubera]|uniref:Thermosome subunit gamma n=1 Tax=Rhynchospora pubera TaxID=906938 RepID=A0AAV8C3A7_9POAL|nr:thermosome subunit gamma [Rhynchospora pubera]
MARLLGKWWPAPLLPLSYYAASRLLTPPDSTILDPTHPHTVKVTTEQFKKGHLMNEFVRFIPCKNGDAAGKLELSIVRYKERHPGQIFNHDFAVDLVSVIPFGESRYYRKLQERLDNYDIVICEGVEDMDSKRIALSPFNVIVSLYHQANLDHERRLADLLSLVLQKNNLRRMPSWRLVNPNWSTILYLEIEKIRREARTPFYERVFTSLQHFGYKLRSRPWQIFVPFPMPYVVYLACSCNDPVLGSVDVLEDILKLGMFSRAEWKFWAAWRFSALWRYNKDYEDTSGSGVKSLIGERNKIAIKELKDAVKRSKCSIAILYGAGHMPDFHKRLTEELDLVPTSMEWITAWSVQRGPRSKYIQPFLNKFPSENRTLILTSLIFATLIVHISAWQAFGVRYVVDLIWIRILAYLLR